MQNQVAVEENPWPVSMKNGSIEIILEPPAPSVFDDFPLHSNVSF